MPKTEQQQRQDILDVGKLIYQKGWVAANDGNISVRLDDGRILCTCTGVSKGMMTPADIIVCDLEGNKIDGARERTTEIAMHLTIYEMRPDVSAVLHAHPPVATGFAVAGRPLTMALLPEVIVSLGCVPLAEYGLPGTPALTAGMLPLIPKYDAILMANHGVVTFGSSVESAYMKMETVEHFAKIALVTHLLGNEQPLGEKEVEKLHEVRHRYNGGGGTPAATRRPVTPAGLRSDLQADNESKEPAGSRQ